jgi:hypothetical protein
MAVSAFKTFVAGEVLTAADLNSSFAQVFDNGEDLGWPSTKAKDLNGQELILDVDADTSITADTDDRIDFRMKGADYVAFDGSLTNVTYGFRDRTSGAVAGPIFNLIRNPTTGSAGGDFIGRVNFQQMDGAAAAQTYCAIATQVDDVTGSNEDSSLLISLFDAGTFSVALDLSFAGGAVLAMPLDMQAFRIDLDADNDTSIRAQTDDQIDFEIAGADDFQMTANTFTALSGSAIATNTINETTAGSGVTIDGALLKDTGISFGNESLAAYDEGTWTPALAGSSTAGVQTYDRQVGTYVKIGKVVYAQFYLRMTAKDGTTAGNLLISGLPFATANISNAIGGAVLGNYANLNRANPQAEVTLQVSANATTMPLYENVDNGAFANLTAADIVDTTSVTGAATYRSES